MENTNELRRRHVVQVGFTAFDVVSPNDDSEVSPIAGKKSQVTVSRENAADCYRSAPFEPLLKARSVCEG